MEKVLDLKMPGVQELGREELMEVDGGFKLNPIVFWGSLVTGLVNIIYNSKESAEIFKESAADELEKIRNGY